MRIKDHTDMIRHLTDPFNIPEARRMIAENPALTQEQFKAGGIVEPGVTHYGLSEKKQAANIKSWEEKTGLKFEDIESRQKKYKVKSGVHTGMGRGGPGQIVKSKYNTVELNKSAKHLYGKNFKNFEGYYDPRLTEGQRATSVDIVREGGGKFIERRAQDYPKIVKEKALKYFKTDEGRQMKWIADNGKKYASPETMMNAFKKEFKVKKVGDAALFKNVIRTAKQGDVGYLSLDVLKHNKYSILKNMEKLPRSQRRWGFTPGYSEGEIFKISILNNHPNAAKNLKTTLAAIDKDFVELRKTIGSGNLTVDEALQTIGKKNYRILNDFDILPGTLEAKGGIGQGKFRTLLLEHGIPQEHINSYRFVINPIINVDKIVSSLSNVGQRQEWGLTSGQANAVQSGWKNVSKGYAQADNWIKGVEKSVGDKKFREIFGKVTFDHTLAKNFGKNYKYLPRDYLLRGKYTTEAFNTTKLIIYDQPMIKLVADYHKADPKQKRIIEGKIKELYTKFNAATDNYAKDFKPSFKDGKFEWKYSEPSPFAKKTIHKYDISPTIAQKELAKGAAGFEKLATFEGTKPEMKVIERFQAKQKEFNNLLSKNIDNLDDATKNILAKANNCPIDASSGGRIGFGPGGVVDCLKSKLNRDPKLFLQNMGSAGLKTKDTNLLKFIKGAKTVAKGTGIFALWEAALAPVIIGWMGSEGERPARIGHELVYGPILEALGVPPKYVPGMSEAEELKEHMGETGFNVDQLLNLFGESKFVSDWDPSGTKQRQEYIPGERDWLVQELNEEINRSANIGGKEGRKSYKQFQIEQKLKKLEEKGRKLIDPFYEGPAGQYFGSEKWMAGEQARTEGLASLEAAKAAQLEEYQDQGWVAKPGWEKKFRTRRGGGGIVSLKK